MPRIKGVKCDGCGATEAFQPSDEQGAWASRPSRWSHDVQHDEWLCPSCSDSE